MVLIRKLGRFGDIKTCGIHDLLRQLCIKESLKEKIFTILNMEMVILDSNFSEISCFLCRDETSTRKRINIREVRNCSTSTALMSPMVCDDCSTKYPQLSESRFIRLINKVNGHTVEIPHTTKLTWLSIHTDILYSGVLEFASPSAISLLWNLQGFHEGLKGGTTVLLSKIWEMPQLRHLHFDVQLLPDPTDTTDFIVLQNLQTLIGVQNWKCTEKVIRRIPNLVKLMAFYGSDSDSDSDSDSEGEGEEKLNYSYYCLNNLALLHKLRSLTLSFDNIISLDKDSIAFPGSLKKLVLTGCGLRWDDMTMIGSLPNLQVLKLQNKAFAGDEWRAVEGQFRQLKYLKLDLLDLVTWIAESSHFPALEMLLLERLHSVEEFPLAIGDMDTLRKIYVANCSESVVDSVMQIKEEQESYGNEVLVKLWPDYIPPTSDDESSY